MLQKNRYEFVLDECGNPYLVGFGSYGAVNLARIRSTEEMVVIKTIKNKNAIEEIKVHNKLNHPNIIKLLKYFYDEEKVITYLVLEFASKGSLHGCIREGLLRHNAHEKIRKYFKNICQAVKYVHQRKFMHRDIKPQNILITADDTAKLCDFGFTTMLQYRITICGTFEYMAPEMIQNKPYDQRIDIWALGILLYEMIEGNAPFRGNTAQEVLDKMKKTHIDFSPNFKPTEIDLIKQILRVNASNRISIAKILSHEYLLQIDNKKQNSSLAYLQSQSESQNYKIIKPQQFNKKNHNPIIIKNESNKFIFDLKKKNESQKDQQEKQKQEPKINIKQQEKKDKKNNFNELAQKKQFLLQKIKKEEDSQLLTPQIKKNFGTKQHNLGIVFKDGKGLQSNKAMQNKIEPPNIINSHYKNYNNTPNTKNDGYLNQLKKIHSNNESSANNNIQNVMYSNSAYKFNPISSLNLNNNSIKATQKQISQTTTPQTNLSFNYSPSINNTNFRNGNSISFNNPSPILKKQHPFQSSSEKTNHKNFDDISCFKSIDFKNNHHQTHQETFSEKNNLISFTSSHKIQQNNFLQNNKAKTSIKKNLFNQHQKNIFNSTNL